MIPFGDALEKEVRAQGLVCSRIFVLAADGENLATNWGGRERAAQMDRWSEALAANRLLICALVLPPGAQVADFRWPHLAEAKYSPLVFADGISNAEADEMLRQFDAAGVQDVEILRPTTNHVWSWRRRYSGGAS